MLTEFPVLPPDESPTKPLVPPPPGVPAHAAQNQALQRYTPRHAAPDLGEVAETAASPVADTQTRLPSWVAEPVVTARMPQLPAAAMTASVGEETAIILPATQAAVQVPLERRKPGMSLAEAMAAVPMPKLIRSMVESRVRLRRGEK